MAIVALVSQKGGVGKSSLVRAIAREAAHAGHTVKVADLDVMQSTTTDWHRLRLAAGVAPAIAVQAHASAAAALREAAGFDLYLMDAPARASKGTLEIARASDLVIQPTGAGLDDLKPATRLYHELKAAGVPADRLRFVLCRVGTSAEESDARAYLEQAGYQVLPGAIYERTAYRAAQNGGKALTETNYKSLNSSAAKLIEAIAECVA